MKRHLIRALAVGLLGATSASLAAPAAERAALKNESYRAADGSRVLQQSIELPAPLAEAWAAFTTTEGFRAWAAPVAQVDMRLGGFIEASYDPDAKIGAPGNIRNEIVAFVPQRMLAMRNRQAPPNTAFDAAAFQKLHTVVLFEPLGERRTRVTIAQPAYPAGEPWDTVYRQFEAGNGWSLTQLHKRFVDGPADWSRLRTPPPVETR